jgi:hypothetical protein
MSLLQYPRRPVAVAGDFGDMGTRAGEPAANLLVCGLPRSGTSLTRGFFAAHPTYAVPRKEMVWWVSLYPRFRYRPEAWEAFLTALAYDDRTRTLGLDDGVLRTRLASVPRGAHHAAFASVLALFAEQAGRPRWGEKTLFAEVYAADVLRALPEVKVIHLIRDPRDVYASYLHARWRTAVATRWSRAKGRVHGHIAWTLRNWRTSVQLARTQSTAWPARYRAVRFEDLVRDPINTLQDLCAFAGVAFDDRMLALDAYPDMVERRGNSSFGPLDGVSAAPVGRFAEVLPARAIALCEALAGDELERNGYAPSGVSLGLGEAWRMRLVDRPIAGLVDVVNGAAFRLRGVPR